MDRAIPPPSTSTAWLALAAALFSPAAALAQAYQCRAPAVLPAARAETGRASRPPLSGYTLSLSWAPEYCRGKERNPADRFECSGANGRFGFVMHGLWPEAKVGLPQYCRAVAPPPAAVVRAQICRTPSVQLIAHEWSKHGSCMARNAAGYFRVGNILADSIRYPAMEALSRAPDLTAGTLRAEFAKVNPGRPASSFGLLVSRTGWLREVGVCLDRRFRSVRCPSRQAGPRDTAAVKIWRGL